MTAATQDIFVRIAADAQRYRRDMQVARGVTSGFAQHAKAEFGRLRAFMGTIHGQMVGLGVGFGAVQLAKDSAKLQKETQLLKVATGGSREEMQRWRNEMYQQQQITGTTVDQQLELSQALQAAGMGMGSITTTLEPASRAMAVAKANADQLGRAMGVAHEQFDIDLTNKDAVTQMLDQMVVAGRLGNAELENLPDIFARVGGRAREANMGMTDTLAIVETLSKSEPQAERLSTLVDSTLRVFTNAKYMKDASKATGVQFFNSDGSRRDPLVVMQEMHTRYQQLHSDAERMQFINKAFGKADMDTTRGMMKLLGGDTLTMLQEYKRQIEGAGGQVKRDLEEAINNSVDQVSRLGGALRKTVNNNFADPLNEAINKGIQYLMNPKEVRHPITVTREMGENKAYYNERRREAIDRANNTGLGLSGGELMGGAAGILASMYAIKLLGGKWGKWGSRAAGLAGDVTGTAQGVVIGKTLQQTAGIQPVYVVNMPDGGIAGGNPVDGLSGIPPVVSSGVNYGRWFKGFGVAGLAIGAGYDAYRLGSDSYSERDKAGAGGSLVGMGSGALLGATIGSIVPIIGTTVGAIVGAGLGALGGEWGSKHFYDKGWRQSDMYDPSKSAPYAQPIAGANLTESAAKWGGEIAQQNAQAVNTIMLTGTAQQQTIGNALVAQINGTQIKGNIAVTVSPSSELLNVRTAVIPGNANTQMTANVGRTGGPAS